MGDVCIMSKRLIKAVAIIATAMMVLLSTATCFAATADTFVKYENDKITVESKMTEITPGSDVTYLATVGEGAPSSDGRHRDYRNAHPRHGGRAP